MSTLLLRLSGPMQSWGSADRFPVRFTGREPTKSGVAGLVCAALGRPRNEPVDDLAALHMAVRVEAEGTVMRDYHTTGGVHRKGDTYVIRRADGSFAKDPIPSTRYYLADADFLVALEGDEGLLRTIEASVRVPRWQLALGRKAFVPGLPVYLPPDADRGFAGGLRPGATRLQALAGEPWPMPGAQPHRRRSLPERVLVRIVDEVEPGDSNEVRMDQPIGAAFRDRTFGPRWVTHRTATASPGASPSADPLTIPLRRQDDVPLAASA